MKEILSFLRDLKQNNDREWFHANKERYLHVQEKWNALSLQLISAVGRFDPDIAPLTLRDCTYRIYRDTRFSNDKSPYKTHFGVFMAKGGKKSMHAGYYFHVGISGSGDYPDGHMLASGNYMYDPQTVTLLREDISDDWEEFSSSILGAAHPAFSVDMHDALKRVPAGYPADSPAADWLRLRNYCLIAGIDDRFLLGKDLVERVAEMFETTKPLIDFINRAADFRP